MPLVAKPRWRLLITALVVVLFGFGGWYYIYGTPKDRAHRYFLEGTRILIKHGGAGSNTVPHESIEEGISFPIKAVASNKTFYNIYTQAITLLTKSLSIDPKNARVYYFLATSYIMMAYHDKLSRGSNWPGYADSAITYYRMSIEHNEYIPESLKNLSIALFIIGKWDDAFAIAERYSWQGKLYWIDGKYLMAQIRICQKDYLKARQIASSMLQGEKSYSTAQLIFAIILHKQRRYNDSKNLFDALITKYPSNKLFYLSFLKKLNDEQFDLCW